MATTLVDEVPTARNILNLTSEDVAQLVRQRVCDRSLSTLVNKLNSTALLGAPADSEEALDALRHLGFRDA